MVGEDIIDFNDYIRLKLKEAREQVGFSQREFAEMVDSAQGTISDLERGRIRINAADLVRFAEVLEKPVQFFLPGVQESNLTEREQLLVGFFRRLGEMWQQSVLDQVRAQVALYEVTAEEKEAAAEIARLPEGEREDAAYRTAYRWLSPLLRGGLRVFVDEQGNVSLGYRSAPGLRIPMPFMDAKDREIALELQRRFDLDPSSGKH